MDVREKLVELLDKQKGYTGKEDDHDKRILSMMGGFGLPFCCLRGRIEKRTRILLP